MRKEIKLFYDIEDDIDYNCVNKCPFGEKYMCGSYACTTKCEHCIGSGSDTILFLSNKKLVFKQGWVKCSKTLKKSSFKIKIMRIIHKIKVYFKSISE